MPSIFARSRTSSNTNSNANSNSNSNTLSPPDEFGRVPSRSSIKGITAALSSPDKKSSKSKPSSSSTNANANLGPDQAYGAAIQDGFLPTNLVGYSSTLAGGDAPEQAYGYLSYQRHVVLGIGDVTRLVEAIAAELGSRGLQTPFLFSNTALDISPSGIKRLINAFLTTIPQPQSQSETHSQSQANSQNLTGQGRASTLPRPSTNSASSGGQTQFLSHSQRTSSTTTSLPFQPSQPNQPQSAQDAQDAHTSFTQELQFSHPHDLGMVLRWGLARLVRVVQVFPDADDGQHERGHERGHGQHQHQHQHQYIHVRGILAWEVYMEWRAYEKSSSYPPHAFSTLLTSIPTPARSLLLTLLTLLTRLLAHSTSSGLTPSALAALFGPLVFGFGNASASAYTSASNTGSRTDTDKGGITSLPFMHAYAAWTRAANAVEHVLLAFVRLMEVGGVPSSSSPYSSSPYSSSPYSSSPYSSSPYSSSPSSNSYGAGGIPIPGRLRSWVKGYPAVLVPLEKMDRTRVAVLPNSNSVSPVPNPNSNSVSNSNSNSSTSHKSTPNPNPPLGLGKRTLRVAVVRRNVRMYSPDLVKTCGTWGRYYSLHSSSYASGLEGTNNSNTSVNDFRSSKIWKRICPTDSDYNDKGGIKGTTSTNTSGNNMKTLPPRYSDAYRKKMDLSAGTVPDYNINSTYNIHNSPAHRTQTQTQTPSTSSPLSLRTTSSTTTTTNSTSTTSTTSPSLITPASSLYTSSSRSGSGDGEDRDRDRDRFRNLTDLKWGVFEESGFAESMTGGPDGMGVLQGKLQFDLNESRRSERYTKRTTLTWADFSSTGFTREDPLLSSTLQFSAPLKGQLTDWPAQAAELQRKLKKAQKNLPTFGWDTSPVVGGEEVVEEAFVDVFCDLIYGGGWMERAEGTFRECNWALVEFKALPEESPSAPNPNPNRPPLPDPRTSTLTILFEEFVPLEYRTQLAQQHSNSSSALALGLSMGMSLPSVRKRLPAFFSPGKSKAWKPAATLNGKPYRIGAVPRSPTAREVEFEGLLRGEGGRTKVIRLEERERGEREGEGLGEGVSVSVSGTGTAIGTGIGIGIGAQAMEKKSKSERAVPSVSVTSPLVAPALKSIATEPTPSSIGPISSVLVSSPVPVPVPVPTVQTSPPNINNANDAAGASASAPPPHPPPLPAKDKDKDRDRESEPKRRFKFSVPGTGSANRHAMLVPAEYDNTLEFDVRLTALSDEEGSSPSGSMEGERVGGKGKGAKGAKMEPWVDILVAGHERRLGSQDAERSLGLGQNGNGNGAVGLSASVGAAGVAAKLVEEELEPVPVRMNDPEEATKELERALEEVKAQQPPTDDEDSEYNVSSALRSTIQKRPNYFDLHPERRLKAIHTGGSFDDNNFYGLSEPSVAPRDSVYTYGSEGDMEPASDTFTYDEERDIEVPAFVDDEDPRTPEDMRRGRLKSDSVILPQASASPVTPLSADGKSKTAALIEMYREKERQSIASPVPSRLPVRSALTENMGVNVNVNTNSNAKAASPTTTPTPLQQIQIQQIELPAPQDAVPGIPETDSVVEEDEEEDGILSEEDDTGPLDPPTFGLDNISRASPLRYVHGAPLHNVLEDEEEEEEEEEA